MGYYPGPRPSADFGPPGAGTQRQDRSALSAVSVATIIFLVGGVVGLTSSALVNLGGLVSTTSGSRSVVLSLPAPWVWGALIGVSFAFDLVGFWFYRSAFRTLAPVDRGFATPATLTLLALLSLLVVLVGVVFLINALYQAVACDGSGHPITAACLQSTSLWAGAAFLVIGAILFLVGFIGMLVGIWRVGRRYSETTIQIGAVLSIIPYLNIVGAILILIGARSAARKVG